jgi:hypothetical protein
MKESFNTLEQYSRRDCVEVRGIPFAEGITREDTNNIVVKVSEVMGGEREKGRYICEPSPTSIKV